METWDSMMPLMEWLMFIAGIGVGIFVGIFYLAILIAGRENDKTRKRIQEP